MSDEGIIGTGELLQMGCGRGGERANRCVGVCLWWRVAGFMALECVVEHTNSLVASPEGRQCGGGKPSTSRGGGGGNWWGCVSRNTKFLEYGAPTPLFVMDMAPSQLLLQNRERKRWGKRADERAGNGRAREK